MEAYIKYDRISQYVEANELDIIFKKIITAGDEIIYYNEKEPVWILSLDSDNKEIQTLKFLVTIVTGKKQNRII